MGTHLRVLSKSYPMKTNMTGLRWFSKPLRPFAFEKSYALALEGFRRSAGMNGLKK